MIDGAWREIGAGVEVLSGRDGGPLSRTVKRILDPLVFRLRVHPEFSAPLLSADVAQDLHTELLAHADTLRACAAWFAVLKARRRALRITDGNAQELYFTVCFELAVTRGEPRGGDTDGPDAILREVHGGRDTHAVEALDALLADPAGLRELAAQVERAWADVRPAPADVDGFLDRLRAVHGDASTRRARHERQQAWSALVTEDAPYELGVRIRTAGTAPWSVVDLGLCATAPQQRPDVVDDRSNRPLDRSVAERVRATLRRSRDREHLPAVPELCAEEADRACAPWGLLAEDLQATMVNGVVVGVQLAPLETHAEADTALVAGIQARLRKEAYVLHARRLLADDQALHPRQHHVVTELAGFVRPYLSRLWARLHGRDVWQEPCTDAADMCALLTGIARSVSLDHRQQIKAMLDPEAA
ncbi:hypothetical protein RB608_22225 [Nocardioides sp. LHD-245]|uniref:hypothetical protein n=1 Tax=Nocardioides sp. LHD-245 TaxID=3051387 RepID=UPI0027E13ADC|nr:hypothetical protein [Nocardioides sp. LHD-245]